MFDHVGLNATSYTTSRAFYERMLAPLGYRVVMASDEWMGAGFGQGDKPEFWVTERMPASKGTHVAFSSPDRATVDAVYAAAIDWAGATTGRPGCASSTTPRITRPSFSTRTATTSRRSAIGRTIGAPRAGIDVRGRRRTPRTSDGIDLCWAQAAQ